MKNQALIVLAALALSACGGNDNNSGSSSSSGGSGSSSGSSSSSSSGSSSSGSGSSSGAFAQGVYCGTFSATTAGSSSSGASSSSSGGTGSTNCSSASTGIFFGVVQADGSAVFFSELGSNFILYSPAPASITGTSFPAVAVTAYGLNGTVVGTSAGGVQNGTLNGSATSSVGLGGTTTTISGTLSGGSAVINFSAASNSADWNMGASVATAAGTYTGTFSVGGTSYAPKLTFATTGAVSGSDTSAKDSTGAACQYNGTLSAHDASHNDYNLTLTSTCLPTSTFNGIGSYFPAGFTNPNGILSPAELKIGVTDGSSTGIYLNLAQ